jgi:hypothetical protein
MQIALTGSLSGGLSRRAQDRKQKRRQNAYYGYHHQKFN